MVKSQAEVDGDILRKASKQINSYSIENEKFKELKEKEPEKEQGKEDTPANSTKQILTKWKAFVTQNNLGLKNSKGEVYLKVEAWNYLFALQGLSPTIVDMSRYGDEDDETLYIAKAALIPISKKPKEEAPLVVTAFGACKVNETDFFKDEYSALSMAQTRAISKLGRTVYAHLAIACGYKATPLEEVNFERESKPVQRRAFGDMPPISPSEIDAIAANPNSEQFWK